MARSKVVCIHSYIRFYNHWGSFGGSGFAIENWKYVLTCAHVVRNNNLVNIQLNTGRWVRGEVTAYDESKDFKLLNGIPTQPAFEFEDMQHVHVGDPVIALGPYRLEDSITEGTICTLDRTAKEVRLDQNNHIRYMETTAAIHCGHSGSPGVNPVTGKVILVNSHCGADGSSIGIQSTDAEEFVRNGNKTTTQYTIGVSMLADSSTNTVLLTDV